MLYMLYLLSIIEHPQEEMRLVFARKNNFSDTLRLTQANSLKQTHVGANSRGEHNSKNNL